MLPTITLQVDDLLSGQTLPDGNVLTHDAETAPGGPFANVLLASVEDNVFSGRWMPPGGNELPLLPREAVLEGIDTSEDDGIAVVARAEIPVVSYRPELPPTLGVGAVEPNRHGVTDSNKVPGLNATIPVSPLSEQPLRYVTGTPIAPQLLSQQSANNNAMTKPIVAPIVPVPATDGTLHSDVIVPNAELPVERGETIARRLSSDSPYALSDRSLPLPHSSPATNARKNDRVGAALRIGTDPADDRIPSRPALTDDRFTGERIAIQPPAARIQKSLPEVADRLAADVEDSQNSTKPTVLRSIPNPTVTVQTPINQSSTIGPAPVGELPLHTNRLAVDATETLVSRPALQHIELAVQDTGWDKLVAERVLVMANGRLQNAEIRLTPAEMGPLRVQLAVEDGAANVTFQTQHALTREAIEHALPRLREMLAENGLTLGQASVDSDGDRGVQQHYQGNAGTERDSHDEAASSETNPGEPDIGKTQDTTNKTASANTIVDTFA